ncbi:TolC family protein [Candidatus Symbiobacter mobilis]|uniref:Outer membrane protein n=1 Tax=Candidatus Symbiobacter mobilis CR TaxID=946483 RepID=U5NDS8_9BURK|nr:TolC family protein [Candidatus Symbiobacter mobilis]AGX88358.1 outer membrane protein [Candidatus Symbiobacter mobilis CR]
MKPFTFLLISLLSHGLAWSGKFQHAYEAALVSDSTFRAARSELASVLQNVPLARAALLPNVALSVSDSRVKGNRTIDNPPGKPVTSPLDYRSPVQSLSLRTPIFHREASKKYELAQAQVSYAEAVLATHHVDLVDRLADAYLQRWSAEYALRAARTQVEASQAQSDLARRRFQLGEGTLTNVSEADTALEMARVLLTEAQNKLEVATLVLRHITGGGYVPLDFVVDALPANVLNAQIAQVPTETLSEYISKAQTSSPTIAARKQAVVLAQLAVVRNGAGHYPRLDVVASVQSSRNDSLSTLNQSVSQRSVGLQLNVPIYSGGYVSASVTQALADQDKAEAELAAEIQRVTKDVTELYFMVANTPAKIQAMQQAVTFAKLALEGAGKGVPTGFTTQADVFASQRKLTQSQYNLAQAIHEHMLARVKLFGRTGAAPEKVTTYMDAVLMNY